MAYLSKFETSVNEKKILKFLVEGIFINADFLSPCLTGIVDMTTNSAENVSFLLEFNEILTKILSLCHNPDFDISTKAMKFIGNLIYTSDVYTSLLLSKNILELMNSKISSTNKLMRKEIYYNLSNILASNKNHLFLMLNHQFLLKKALEGLLDLAFEVRYEAWYLFSFISRLKTQAISEILEELIYYLPRSLEIESDPKILELILNTCENILKLSTETDKFKGLFNETGAFDSLAKKKYHGNNHISAYTLEIIESNYSYEELHGISSFHEENYDDSGFIFS